MSKVLLVLSTSGTPDEVINYAVERALKDKSGLVALYLLDKELAREAFDAFSDIGFIGDRPSQELSESLMREYRQRGYEELGRVQVKAMEAGVDYEPVMEEGGYVSTVLDMISSTGAHLAVLVRRRERSFMKYFSMSLAEEVRKQASCEVVIFREE